MGNKMKNPYFLGRLSFSVLGFLFHSSQEIGSMEGNVDISMASSSSKSSLGVENDRHLSSMDCSASPKVKRKRNPTTSDRKLGKEHPRSKYEGIPPLKIGDIERASSLSSMDCSMSPGKGSNRSMSGSLISVLPLGSREQVMQGKKPRKRSLDSELEAMISADGFVEACNVVAFWMSGSNKFTHIKVQGKMTDEDIAKLCTWKFSTNLKEVNWEPSSEVSLFFQQILRCHWDQSLIEFNLFNEDLKGPIPDYIGLAIAKNQRLTAFNVHLNHMSVQGSWVQAIVDPLIAHKALKTVDFSYSWLGGFGNAIAKVLVGNTTVAEFKLGHCALFNSDVNEILQALRKNTTLTGFDLRGNQMGVSGAEKITEALTQNLISMDSSTMFPVVLYQPQFLKILNLGSNGLGDKGAEYIAEILKNNTVLTELNLSQNKIGPAGICHLADSLANNTTLKTLELQHNEIGVGADTLALQLPKNKALIKLNLGDNQIGESVKHIAKSLIKNKTQFRNTALTILDLRNNNIRKKSIKYIVEMLTENTSLTEFNVCKNQFNVQDAMKIIAALSKNSTLTILNLGFYGITMEHVPDISKLLKKNSTLRVLDLGEETSEDVRQSINGFLSIKSNSSKGALTPKSM